MDQSLTNIKKVHPNISDIRAAMPVCDVTHSNEEGSKSFQRADLAKAKVISQVDRKFVACTIANELGEKTLVLVDQHAADERVRVERFLKDLCMGFLNHDEFILEGAELELEPPVPVLLSRREAEKLATSEDYQSSFTAWGFRFHDLRLDRVSSGTNCDDYIQVYLQGIPDVVSEKVNTPFHVTEMDLVVIFFLAFSKR